MATASARHACTMRTGESWQIGSTNQPLRSNVRLSKFRTQSAGIPSSVESRTSDGIPRIRFVAGLP
jgi:hypothetical protein